MNRRADTIRADWFDALYRSDADPWQFRTSAYEREKYAATLDHLGRAFYPHVLEVGCSIGVFTAQLAARCGTLLAIDASSVALGTARDACAALENVRFAEGMVPRDFPAGPFDLIVLSEIVYYLTISDVRRLADACRDQLAEGGEILLCHWLGETDYPLSGEEAADHFIAAARPWTDAPTTRRADAYRLDRLRGDSHAAIR